MKRLTFKACIRIIFFSGLLFFGMAADIYAQEFKDQGPNKEGDYYVDSVAAQPSPGLRSGMLMINGRTSLRFYESSYNGSTQADLVIAPRVYYFLSRSWAAGILFQFEHHFGEGEDLRFFGIGQGNEIFINLGNDRSYLNFDFAMLFLIGGGGGSFMDFKYGVGFSQFMTDEIAISANLDITYYLFEERREFSALGDELRLQIGISYFLRNLKGRSK